MGIAGMMGGRVYFIIIVIIACSVIISVLFDDKKD
jgi:hypothetical protein